MDIKLVISVPHTGTNTVLSVLKGERIELGVLLNSPTLMKRTIYKGNIERGLVKNNIVWGHFNEKQMKFIQALALGSRFIIPLRDPLAALCSSENRQKGIWPQRLEAWRLLAEGIWPAREMYLPQFVPVEDIKTVEHSRGIYPLKKAYYAKDMKTLKQVGGYRELVAMESLLRPMLEANGFKDLLWWNNGA